MSIHVLIHCLPIYTVNCKLYADFFFFFQMWIYVTWIFWLGIHAAWYLWLLFVGGSVPLWICFLQSWRGDPGIITATHEDKLNVLLVIFTCKIISHTRTTNVCVSLFADDN